MKVNNAWCILGTCVRAAIWMLLSIRWHQYMKYTHKEWYMIRFLFHVSFMLKHSMFAYIERNFVTLLAQMSCAHHDRDFIKQLEVTFTQFQYNALFSLFICYDVHHADLHRYTKQTRNVTFRFTQFARTFSVAIRAWNSHHIYIWRLFPWLAMKFVWCNRHTHSDMQLCRQPNCVFIFTCYYVLFAIVVIAVPKLQPCTVRLHHALKFARGWRKTYRKWTQTEL